MLTPFKWTNKGAAIMLEVTSINILYYRFRWMLILVLLVVEVSLHTIPTNHQLYINNNNNAIVQLLGESLHMAEALNRNLYL